MPQQHMVIPHYMRNNREPEAEIPTVGDTHQVINRENSSSSASSEDIPLLIPQEADGADASNGQLKMNGSNDFRGQPSRPSRVSFSFRKSKVEPLVPDMPMRGFVDDRHTLNHEQELFSDVVAHSGTKTSDKEWWETQERGNLVVSADESGQVGPRVSCRCQVSLHS